MVVNLTKEEVGILTELLRTRGEQLRVEVRRTDDPQYHDELRDLERRTLQLLRKVEDERRTDQRV